MSEHYTGCEKGDHCWDRLGSVSYNQATNGTIVEKDTERCRHCPAKRVRTITSKAVSEVIEDTGWRHEDAT